MVLLRLKSTMIHVLKTRLKGEFNNFNAFDVWCPPTSILGILRESFGAQVKIYNQFGAIIVNRKYTCKRPVPSDVTVGLLTVITEKKENASERGFALKIL